MKYYRELYKLIRTFFINFYKLQIYYSFKNTQKIFLGTPTISHEIFFILGQTICVSFSDSSLERNRKKKIFLCKLTPNVQF